MHSTSMARQNESGVLLHTGGAVSVTLAYTRGGAGGTPTGEASWLGMTRSTDMSAFSELEHAGQGGTSQGQAGDLERYLVKSKEVIMHPKRKPTGVEP